MTGVREMPLGPDAAEVRLDRWLRRLHPHLQQGLIERMCRKGDIRVDGARVKPATRLAEGQVLRLPPIPEPSTTPPPLQRDEVSAADAEMIRACVLWRDDDVLALNKPAGLAVQGGSGQHRHLDGLAEALRFGRDEKPRL